MSATLPQADWIERAGKALAMLREQRELRDGIKADVEAFFAANPHIEQTPENTDWVTILAFERIADQSKTGATA